MATAEHRDGGTVSLVNVRDAVAEKHLKAVRRKAALVEKARVQLLNAVLAAQRSGESVRGIAPWAGMSPTAVQRLLDEAKRIEREQQRQ